MVRRYAFLAKPVGSALADEALKPTEACADGTAAGNPAYLKTVFNGWYAHLTKKHTPKSARVRAHVHV